MKSDENLQRSLHLVAWKLLGALMNAVLVEVVGFKLDKSAD